MELSALTGKITEALKKYKYALLVLAVGIALMLVPSPQKEQPGKSEIPVTEVPIQKSVEDRLEEILSQIDGAGKVEVMLTVGAGAETVYQTEESTSVSDTSNSVQKSVVTVTDADRNQTGLICQIKPPEYLGAIVVCQGAENPQTRLAIVNAVAGVTGLRTDRISVLKMK